jgi:hypothetical protein
MSGDYRTSSRVFAAKYAGRCEGSDVAFNAKSQLVHQDCLVLSNTGVRPPRQWQKRNGGAMT